MRNLKTLAASCVAACGLAAGSASAATLVLVNIDPPNVGFNDPTPATPVGGNEGTTVGDQRLIAFQRALDLWGSVLDSDVPILVEGSFGPQACNATGGVLASAGPFYAHTNFTNAPLPDTWYPGALANSLAGEDLVPEDLDLGALFNGNIGQPNCIAGSGWYYGLDNNSPANLIDFLDTFMHEVSHGLGFTYFASRVTGNLFNGLPDHYTTLLRDVTSGLGWNEMTSAQRLASRISDSNLVWTGAITNQNAKYQLNGRRFVTINKGPLTGTEYIGTTADFGVLPSAGNFKGNVVLVNDGVGATSDACEPMAPGSLAGVIALADRGTCAFTIKAVNVQNAGAKGLLLANNAAAAQGFTANIGGTDPAVTIPTLGIGLADGAALKAALPTSIKLRVYTGQLLEGSNGPDFHNQFVQLYAPTTFASGSSVAHFDQRHAPNALMEPAITSTLRSTTNLDLTPFAFQDMGWRLRNLEIGGCDTGGPNVTCLGDILSVQIDFCAADSETNGQYRRCVARLAEDLASQGLITRGQQAGILSCASRK